MMAQKTNIKKRLKIKFDKIVICFFKLLIFFVQLFKIHNCKKSSAILVLSYFNLGDIICDTPSLHSLREAYPNHKIICLVRSDSHKVLMERCPYVDEVQIIYSEYNNSIFDYYKLLKSLSTINFMASFQLVRHYGQLRKSFIPYILGIKKRYGLWDVKRSEFSKCFTHPVVVDNKKSRKEESISVVEAAGIEVVDRQTHCWYTEEDTLSLFCKFNLDIKYLNVIIHLGGTDPIKCWDIDNFINVATELNKKYLCNFILTGIESEHNKVKEFLAKYKFRNTQDMCGKLTIFELFSLIKFCDLMITSDTGPMHFAIALRKKVVAIFGPTPPLYAIGYYDHSLVRVVRGKTICDENQHCQIYQKFFINNRSQEYNSICHSKYMVCTNKVTPEQVYYECVDLLELENRNVETS